MRIIHKYANVNEKTLEKQLIENKFPLQKRLASNYFFGELK